MRVRRRCGLAALAAALTVTIPAWGEDKKGKAKSKVSLSGAGGRLELEKPVTAHLRNPPAKDRPPTGKGPEKSFTLTVDTARRVTITVESVHFDAKLRVKAPGGAQVAEDDDSGPGDGAQVAFEAKAKVGYQVTVGSAAPTWKRSPAENSACWRARRTLRG